MNDPIHEQIATSEYEPTAKGLESALYNAIARNTASITHTGNQKPDRFHFKGGDNIILYTDPTDPQTALLIAPVGSNLDDRWFFPKSSDTSRVSMSRTFAVAYLAKPEQGGGNFRVTSSLDGRKIEQWNPDTTADHAGSWLIPSEETYTHLIAALGRGTSQKPSRTKRALRLLGRRATS